MLNLQMSNSMKSKFRLIKNILILAVLVFVAYLVYNFFVGDNKEDDWEIEDTPLHIETIKTIAEISTVSYRDEVVVDTVEFYKDINEQIVGNTVKLIDVDQWKYGIKSSNTKRRLTLIVKGEVRYGLNLTGNNYKLEQNKDTIWLTLPKPEILDVIVTPSSTEIFLEHGEWADYERKKLERKAGNPLRVNYKKLNLEKKTQENVCRLFENMIPGDKKIIFNFE